MGGMKFEYDEEGGTFYYFLLSFVALILFPATYYLWPRKDSKDDQKKKCLCNCEPCVVKRQNSKSNQPRKKLQKALIRLLILCGWVFFIFLAYKTSQVELDFKEFDPYGELEIERGASVTEIKKAYRRLSLIFHPDRGTGNSHKFMKITKAHDALTDDEARKNWEEYGNPDGPGATQVGIALPKWIVEKQNSIWVLGAYALVFMIILPICVGTWWYRSIKYSAQQVLIDTTKMYYSFLRRSPSMILKRVILVLSGSCEFWKRFNSEVIERPSDNVEIPELIRDLPQATPVPKEQPFNIPYSVKARALLLAHFSGKRLGSKSLEYDRDYILKKCPYLLNEMLSLAQQLYFLTQAEKYPYRLSLDTVDNIMKLSQMCIQGLWHNKSPLLQLPHISEDMLRHFNTKKRQIRSLKDFGKLGEEERRSLLRHLSDKEYRDVMVVFSNMPYNVQMEVTCEVKGDEDKTITAGSIVTVTIHLKRNNTSLISENSNELEDDICGNIGGGEGDEEGDHLEEEGEELANKELNGQHQQNQQQIKQPQQKQSVWQKPKKKKGGGKKNKTKKNTKTIYITTNTEEDSATGTPNDPSTQNSSPSSSVSIKTSTPNGTTNKKSKKSDQNLDEDEDQSSDQSEVETNQDRKEAIQDSNQRDHDDDDEWVAFQKETKKENALEAKSKETHLVHCPNFPVEKYEWWWIYLADLKKKQLIAGPIQLTTLKDFEEKELRFTAPNKPGTYQFSIVLRSDSYTGVDQITNVKIQVNEAKKVPDPVWEISDDEEERDLKNGNDDESYDESYSDDSSYEDDDNDDEE